MQKLLDNSILSVLGFTTLLFLASCGTTVEPVQSVEVRTVEVKPPKPIVPTPDQLDLRDFKWVVITPDNIDEVFNDIEDQRNQLEVTCKTGRDAFKKHFLGLSDNVTYFVEQLEARDVNVYHYRVTFKPQGIIPDIDLRLSGSEAMELLDGQESRPAQ